MRKHLWFWRAGCIVLFTTIAAPSGFRQVAADLALVFAFIITDRMPRQ